MAGGSPRERGRLLPALLVLACIPSAASAATIGDDAFAYPVGPLPGNNGGTGWSAAWGSADVDVIGTTLSDPSGQLVVAGGATQLGMTPGAFRKTTIAPRDLTSTLGTNGTTTWFSILVKPDRIATTDDYAGLNLGTAVFSRLFFGYSANKLTIQTYGLGGSADLVAPAVTGQTVFLVLKVDFAAGNDTATLYYNPTPGLAAPDSTDVAVKSDLDINGGGTFTQLGIAGGQAASVVNDAELDEIRVGDTFADVAPAVYAIEGTVFEDFNYGGGSGRSLAASSGSPRSGARVELYDGGGNYVTFTTTNGSGVYSFSGLSAGTHTVRITNDSVTSSRTGYVASLRPVQTFRTDATSGAAVAVTDYVGGQDPGVVDAGDGQSGSVMDTTTGVFTAGPTSGTAQSIAAATYTGSDVTGVDFGFSFNVICNTNNAGQGSLRQLLDNTDALDNTGLAQAGRPAGIDNAIFMLADGTARPGMNAGYPSMFSGGVATISLTGILFAIDDPVILDATTHPAFAGTPIVVLDGALAGAVDGFTFDGGGSTLRGWVVNGFNSNGIYVSGSGGNTIQGCYVGTNATATAKVPNGANGISIVGPGNNTIGGAGAGDANVIAGNNGNGVSIQPGTSDNNDVYGNYIGTNASGADLGNTLNGVRVTSGSGNSIGGAAANQGNTIAFNGQDGVLIRGSTADQNLVSRNSIHSNGNIGIDLDDNGVSPNNGTKTGTEPNDDQDYPVFTVATLSGSTLRVEGYVGTSSSKIAAVHTIEVFKADDDGGQNGEIELGDAQSVAHGEGRWFVDSCSSAADGTFDCSLTVPGSVSLSVGDPIAGVAIDGSDDTSEFGANFTVAATPTLVKRAFQLDGTPIADTSVLPTGTPVRYLLYINNTGAAAIDDVSVQDVLDAAYAYSAGSIRMDDSVAACAATTCTAAEEAAIFAAVDAQTGNCGPVAAACTDAVDADPVSWNGTTTIDAGNRVQANGQLDIAAAKVWALLFTVNMQ